MQTGSQRVAAEAAGGNLVEMKTSRRESRLTLTIAPMGDGNALMLAERPVNSR
jgi:hypothetical protein